MIDHPHDFKSVVAESDLHAEEFQLRHKTAYAVHGFNDSIPMRYLACNRTAVVRIFGTWCLLTVPNTDRVGNPAGFLVYIGVDLVKLLPHFFRILVRLIQIVPLAELIRKRIVHQLQTFIGDVGIADHRIVPLFVEHDQVQSGAGKFLSDFHILCNNNHCIIR